MDNPIGCWCVYWIKMALEMLPHGATQRWAQGQWDMYLRLFGTEINGAFFVFIMWCNDAIRLIKSTFWNIYTFIYTLPPWTGGNPVGQYKHLTPLTHSQRCRPFYCIVMDDFSLAFFTTVQHLDTPPLPIWVQKEATPYSQSQHLMHIEYVL